MLWESLGKANFAGKSKEAQLLFFHRSVIVNGHSE